MPQYEFWYDEITTRKAFFEADDNVEAKGILEMLEAGEIGPEDIDGVFFKDKGYSIEIDPLTLSRLDGEDV
jgi:hypothetical protein